MYRGGTLRVETRTGPALLAAVFIRERIVPLCSPVMRKIWGNNDFYVRILKAISVSGADSRQICQELRKQSIPIIISVNLAYF
jgi:hypothetical protein